MKALNVEYAMQWADIIFSQIASLVPQSSRITLIAAEALNPILTYALPSKRL
jgi:hypothetical protein